MIDVHTPYAVQVEPILRRALDEDLGVAGDLTSGAVVPAEARARGLFVARRDGRVAGLDIALRVFALLDPSISAQIENGDGSDVAAGTTLAMVEGPARPILTGERTALNLLTRMSGIATGTRAVVAAVADYETRVACTRKTTPGLRVLEKYAVRVGGGTNHRFGLNDGVLIKDNHIVAAGGIEAAVKRARTQLGHMVKLEVEVDTLDQLDQLLGLEADAVLLDNMGPDLLRQAVDMVGGRLVTEASGNLSLDTVRDVAAAGVDLVSLGGLTHSAAHLDIGLDFETA